MRVDIDAVPAMVVAYRQRWAARDERMEIMNKAVAGDFDLTDEYGDGVDNKSPNIVQVALEDTAEAASLIPSVRTRPSSPDMKDQAYAMDRMAMAYFDLSQIELLTIRSMLDLAAYGQISWVVVMNEESGSPVIQWRNPRMCYQETGWHTMDSAKRVVFLRDVYASQLPRPWQNVIYSHMVDGKPPKSPAYWDDKTIQLVEIYTEEETLICALYKGGSDSAAGFAGGASKATYVPIELSREDAIGNMCPAIVAERISLDGEPRGQFDQVIRVMKGHIQLMSTLLDYADQAVYSDVWVKDLIGTMPVGGGSYIQLGPQGAIGRVQPAVSSLQVFEELDRLMDGIHVGGRWPKTRPGDVDQSQASGKFMETTAAMMNTSIRTMHFIMKRALEQALRVAFVMDKAKGRDRTIAGVLKNQQFMIERTVDDIDLGAKVRVEYGLGLGREPAQSMVLGIQAAQAGLVSNEFVQENFEGIQDVELERNRIDVQQLKDMAFAKLMEGLQTGEVPLSALTKISKARSNGDDIFDLIDEFLVKPQEEAEASAMTSGMDGSQMQPGAAPLALGAGAPPVPPPEEILGGGPAGPPGPGGPEGPTSIARTSVPAGGPGSFAGVETRR